MKDEDVNLYMYVFVWFNSHFFFLVSSIKLSLFLIEGLFNTLFDTYTKSDKESWSSYPETYLYISRIQTT